MKQYKSDKYMHCRPVKASSLHEAAEIMGQRYARKLFGKRAGAIIHLRAWPEPDPNRKYDWGEFEFNCGTYSDGEFVYNSYLHTIWEYKNPKETLDHN